MDPDINDLYFLHVVANNSYRPSYGKKPRTFRSRSLFFDMYDERDFKRRFRVSKVMAMLIIDGVKDQVEHPTEQNHALSAELQVLTCLRYYATGCFQRVAGDLSGVSVASVCRIVRKVSRAIASLKEQYISMPTHQRAQQVKKEFFSISGFPGVIGCIDCTHVRISCPTVPNPALYVNRKGIHHSLRGWYDSFSNFISTPISGTMILWKNNCDL